MNWRERFLQSSWNSNHPSTSDSSPVSVLELDPLDHLWNRVDIGTESRRKLFNNQKSQYIFAHQGLIKKTISALIDGHTYHLVCYYSTQDFGCRDGRRFDLELHKEMQSTVIPLDLLIGQNFRKPEASYCLFHANFNSCSRRNSAALCNNTSEYAHSSTMW